MKQRTAQQIERTWEGTHASVRAALTAAAERGQLVHAQPVRPYRGEVAVRVSLVPGAAPASPARRLRPRTVAVLAVLGALITAAAVGTVAWAVVAAGMWLADNWQALAATALGVAALLWLVGAGLGALAGGGTHGHCSGPNTGH